MVMENRYDKYKDSGIAWIGEIPEHWEKICLKRLSNINTGNQDTQDSVSDGKYPFFVRSPKVERSNKYTFEGASILMAGDGVGAGKVFHLADGKFACHQRVYCINQFKRVNRIYLFYYLSSLFYHVIESANSKSTVDSVRLPMLAEFPVFMPIGFEQQSIATYLDQKCGEIDELITLQEEMITKLQSYKQSVITEAVTKGLDKNVPLKDSGIEWIGEIPEHWEINKLFRVCELKARVGWKGLQSSEFEEKSYAYLVTGQDFRGPHINWSSCYQINKERYDEDPYIQLKNDDLLITKDGTIGKVAIVSNLDKPACLNSGIFVMRKRNNEFITKYMYWLFVSSLLSSYNNDINSGASTIMHLYQSIFYQMPLPIPPLPEQETITNYLDQKCSEIDELITIKQQKIEKLKDYKKSLIFECVTGKRKV